MTQQLFWETSPVITPEVREEIGRAVDSEIARTMAGLMAWKLLREYLASHDVGEYMQPWQQRGTVQEACARLVK